MRKLIYVLSILFCIQAFGQHGFPDTTFGNGGFLDLTNPGDLHVSGSFLRTHDGLIYHSRLFNDAIYPDINLVVENLRLFPNGSLDQGYGNQGISRIAIDSLLNLHDTEIDPNTGEKYLALSTVDSVTVGRNILIIRIDTLGFFDTSFAQAGFFNLDLNFYDDPVAIEVQDDGKIMVVASTSTFQATSIETLVFRLKKTGELDSTFGNNGIVLLNPFNRTGPTDLVISGNNKIFVSGTGEDPNLIPSFYNSVIKLNSNGTLDSTFGSHGTTFFNSSSSGDSYGGPITLSGNGKLLVGGQFLDNGVFPIIVAYDSSSGLQDSTFGENGFTKFENSPGSTLFFFNDIEVQPNGMILGTGRYHQPGLDPCIVVRFLPGGTIDSAGFGTNGISVEGFQINAEIEPSDILILDNDSFLIAGSYENFTTVDYGTYLAKYSTRILSNISAQKPDLKHIVYPNPTKGGFRISGNWPEGSRFKLEINRADGREISSQSGFAGNGEILVRDLGATSPGIFFYQLNIEGRSARGKLVKQ